MKTKNRVSEMSQCEMVLYHIKKYGSITDREAVFDYGIMRLGSVIHILRKQGYNIKTNMTTGKNRFKKSVTFATYTMGDTNNE